MDVLARFALPGILALSAVGALIVGVLLVRYGVVSPEDEDVDDAEDRVTATRMAHALVATCLAGIAVLAVAALLARPAASSRATTAAVTPAPTSKTAAEPASGSDASEPGQSGQAGEPRELATSRPGETARGSGETTKASGDEPSGSGTVTPAPRESVGAARESGPAVKNATPAPRETTSAPREAAPVSAPREDRVANPSARDDDEIKRLRAQVAAIEQRLDRREPAGAAALPPRIETRAEIPAKVTPPRAASLRRADPPPTPAREDGAALPVLVGKPQISTTIQGVRVDVHRQALDGQGTLFTIRLADPGNRPLTGADVSLVGLSPDGLPVRAALVPVGEPGFYRARVAARSAEDLRLRVVHASALFEVSLDQAVSW